MSESNSISIPFWISLLAGGIAGTTVDIALYPLDTVKTRLQSAQGFVKSGGFKGIYKGLGVAALGSSPGAALFFCTYDTMKYQLEVNSPRHILPNPVIHMLAASLAEIVACSVRVPTEVIKQRMQTGMYDSMTKSITGTISKDGLMGLYKGYGITIMREIPFSFIQFPIYEKLKIVIAEITNRTPKSYEAALCGSFAGGIAAALTTPLDVIKTRLMLGSDLNGVPYYGALDTMKRIHFEGPRVMWISIGGFVFFGAYEKAKSLLIEKIE